MTAPEATPRAGTNDPHSTDPVVADPVVADQGDSGPAAEPPRPRPNVQVGRALAGLGVAALIGLICYAAATGAQRHIERGDPYPGRPVAIFDVAGYFVAAGLAALCLGALAFVVAGSRPAADGIIDATVYRAHRSVAAVSPVWALVAWLMVGVAAADGYGVSPGTLISTGHLFEAIGVSEKAVAYLVVAILATIVAVVSRFVLSWIAHLVLLIPVGVAVAALPMAGNGGQGPNHDYTTSLVILFVLAVAVSLGYRCAFALAPVVRQASDRQILERRHALIVCVSDIVALLTGIGLVGFWVPARYVLTTPFGVAAVVTLAVLAGAAVTGALALRRGDAARIWPLTLVGGALMVVVLAGWTVIDTRVAPGLLAHQFTAWDVFLGYELPGAPSVATLTTYWRFDFVIGTAAVVAAVVYGAAVWQLRRRGDQWQWGRTAAWMLGCAVIVVVTGSGVRAYGSAMFSIHMAEHMALNMFAPVLLVLGAPATLALRALPTAGTQRPPGPREWLNWTLHSTLTRVLSNPAVAFLLFVLSLYVVYFTPIFGTLTRYHWGHILLTIHFIVVGYLFFWVIAGIDPGPRRIPYLARIGLLFAVMPFHAFFGIALMTMTSVIGDKFYSQLDLSWVSDRLDDQWLGGAIAWGASEVPVVLVVVAIVAQWAKSDRRAARRADRHAETYEDVELDNYNAMLDELAKSRR